LNTFHLDEHFSLLFVSPLCWSFRRKKGEEFGSNCWNQHALTSIVHLVQSMFKTLLCSHVNWMEHDQKHNIQLSKGKQILLKAFVVM